MNLSGLSGFPICRVAGDFALRVSQSSVNTLITEKSLLIRTGSLFIKTATTKPLFQQQLMSFLLLPDISLLSSSAEAAVKTMFFASLKKMERGSLQKISSLFLIF
jgi:hypothetical protein